MGHNPIAPRHAPDRESLDLGRAREAYVEGKITLEEFEELAAGILRGGALLHEPRAYDLPTSSVVLPMKPAEPPRVLTEEPPFRGVRSSCSALQFGY